jgi:transposase-like protein
MVEELGKPATVVAEELGLNRSTLWRWIAQARGTYGTRGRRTQAAGTARDPVVAALEAENKRLRMENDFLKQAAAFFVKTHL